MANHLHLGTGAALAAAALALPAHAQQDEPIAQTSESQVEAPSDASAISTIVVTAKHLPGAVETDAPPITELTEAEIAATGATSVPELLSALAPQTGTGRGRGGGFPVMLINGQRISNFREMRDLPTEAIKQVQVFSEEVALQYGYRPDQRVINFILKQNFASFNAELEVAAPEKGGYAREQVEYGITRFGKSSRFNLHVEYEHSDSLTEADRAIIPSNAGAPFSLTGNVTGISGGEIDPALSAAAGRTITVAPVPSAGTTLAAFAANANAALGGNIGQFRTLLPSSNRLRVNSGWTRILSKQSNLSFNASFETDDKERQLGLPFASLTVPSGTGFSPFSAPVQLNRYFASPRPLSRSHNSSDAQFGFGLNAPVKSWNLSLTGNYQHVSANSRTFTNADFSVLRAGILAGTVNPFSTGLGNDLLFLAPDITHSLTNTANLNATLTGKPLILPAGPVLVTLRAGFDRQTIDSETLRAGINSAVSLGRNSGNAAVNIEVPLAERGMGGLGKLGTISINGNYGVSRTTARGTLTEYGAGLRWSPADGISITASLIGDENAPGLSQLGNPLVVTPNVSIYDFTRGQSRIVEVISGGNPALLTEKRRDLKFGIDWQPKFVERLGLQFEYFINRSRNTTASFPLLTSEIEAAFPSRATRDAAGQLIRLDQRPVNFDRQDGERIRWGFNYSAPIGKAAKAMMGAMSGGQGGRPGGGGPPAGPRPGGGSGSGRPGGGPPMGMPGMGGPPSNWMIGLAHTYHINENILVRSGVPPLDLLGGSAVDASGGMPRHEISLNGGAFLNGMGLRLEGNYRSATHVNGSGLPGSSDLFFGSRFSLNMFLFVSLDQRGKLAKNIPFFKNARVMFKIDNLLNDYVEVHDAAGTVPLSYQRGLIDPQGRVFEISFRKRF